MNGLLYVADNFQILQDGKVLAVGMFADRVVVLNVPEEAPEPSREMPFGIQLGFLMCLRDLPSVKVSGNVSIEPPDGKPLISPFAFSASGSIGGSVNIIVSLNPFLISCAGNYRVLFETEMGVISESLEIRVERIKQNPAAPVTTTPIASA